MIPLYNPTPSSLSARWRQLPREHQVAVVLGTSIAALLITGGIVAAAIRKQPTPPPRRLINADAACNTPTISDPFAWSESIRNRVRQAAGNPGIDPFTITSQLITSESVSCSVYPSTTKNPGEAKFYAQTFMQVVKAMSDQNLASAEQATMWNQMMLTWASTQGVNLSEL